MAKTPRRTGDAELSEATKIQNELERVLHDQQGRAGNVEFDFTHESLSTEEWQLPPLWLCEIPDSFPFLWFPWQGKFNEETTSSRPDYFVKPGDKIWLRHVWFDPLPGTTLLDPEFERRFAFGYLSASSKNGDTVPINRPVPIFRKGRISGTGTYFGNEFHHLCARVSTLLATQQLDKGPNPYLEEARSLALLIERDLSLYPEGERSYALRLASLGAVAGHLLTKAEQFEVLLPLAMSGSKAKARARDNGKMSGERRRSKRLWVAEATELAKALFAEARSQRELADMIGEKLKDLRLKAPGDSTLTNHIRELQQKGELPRDFPLRSKAGES